MRGIATLALGVLFLGSCGGSARQVYEGARRPRAEVASIEGEENMTFVAVDGRSTHVAPDDEGTTSAHWIEVLEGQHTVDVDWARSLEYREIEQASTVIRPMRFANPVSLTFNVRMGRRYDIKALAMKRTEEHGRSSKTFIMNRAEVRAIDREMGEVLATEVVELTQAERPPPIPSVTRARLVPASTCVPQSACDADEYHACAMLGRLYRKGIVVEKSDERGRSLAAKAARLMNASYSAGDPLACYELADDEPSQAASALERACAAGALRFCRRH